MKTLLLFSACLALFFASQAQSWYSPGTDFTFTSISATDSTEAITLTVRYNAAGNATVTKTTSSVGSADKDQAFYFGPDRGWAIQGDSLFLDDNYGYDYWMIPFNTYSKQIAGGVVTITCFCKSGSQDADCDAVWHVTNNGYILTVGCVPTGGCNRCKKPKVTGGSVYEFEEGFLILNANNVTLK